jgi:hypothetical protein
MTEVQPVERRALPWLGVAVTAIALAPYLTVLLRFQTALWVQGTIILAVVSVLLLFRVRALPRAALDAPRAVQWGLGLYTSAAVWGAVVGLASGNPTRYVVTQLASMLLLPAAFFAFSTPPLIAGEQLAGGLGVAAGVALAIHIAAFLGFDGLLPPPGEPFRFCLRNDVSFTGLAVMGFLVAAAWFRSTKGWAACGAFLCLAVLVVGGMSRGAWAAAALGIAVWAGLSGAVRLRWIVWAAAVLIPVVAVAAIAAHRIGLRAEQKVEPSLAAADGPSVSPAPGAGLARVVALPGSGPKWTPLAGGMALEARAIEVEAWLLGEEGTKAKLWVEGHRGPGEATIRAPIRQEGRNEWTKLWAVEFLPEGVRTVDFRIWTSGGQWLLSDLRMRPLEGTAEAWLRALRVRFGATVIAFTVPGADPTLRYRWGEWRAVRARWAEAEPWRLALGYGLGAPFRFINASYDPGGRRVMLPNASYIHNFFVFLGFKLGLAGLGALVGLLLLAGGTAVRAVRERGSGRADWLVPAAAAAWLAYLVWGLTSPELLDFRVVPALGALLAATAPHSKPRTNERV